MIDQIKMKNSYNVVSLILVSVLLFNSKINGQGFSTTPTNWTIPSGGSINSAGTVNGFYTVGSTSANAGSIGSQNWSVLDINGDGKQDIVVTSEYSSGGITVFSPSSNPYWKVYLNTGSGYSTTATNWTVPTGGSINSAGTVNGFFLLTSTSANNGSIGSQNWSVMDINGDGKQDIVVTSEYSSGGITVFSPSSNPYWKVYLNTGTGFSTTATNWAIPTGGSINSTGTVNGFYTFGSTSANAGSIGSQNWSVLDINGDGKQDIVVTSEYSSGGITVYSPSLNPYWKVYLNTGTGFSTIATNWAIPTGGSINSAGTVNGFFLVGSTSANNGSIGSQNWSVLDINGDGKQDIVVTSEYSSGGITVFSPSTNPYWKAYLNTGSGFSSTATNWAIPTGGSINSAGTVNGFFLLGSTSANNGSIGSQNWSVLDINGDGKLDIVVTSEYSSSGITVYSPSTNPYWKVYLNTGSGISTTATNWTIPSGGSINSAGTVNGFFLVGSTSANTGSIGSQNWIVMDINGDGNQDIVVTAEYSAGGITVFNPSSNPYWKVYLNSGFTGVEQFENEKDNIVIYPNPSAGKLFIQRQDENKEFNLEVADMTGKIILQKHNTNEIDLTNSPKGIYLIKILEGDKIQTKKIVVQ